MPIELVMPSNQLILCCPHLLLPSIFPSIRVFSNESALRIRRPEYWSFSLSISPSNEYSKLVSFRIDWFDLFAVQGTLKSSPAPQFESINSLAFSLLNGSTLTSVHAYRKTQSLTLWTFVTKVMSLLFNMLCRFFIAFLWSSKCLLISWLQSLSAVILEPSQNKICQCFHFFPFYYHSLLSHAFLLFMFNVFLLK